MPDPLKRYRTKRNFAKTPEPGGELVTTGADLVFVIQKHAATRLHYDFRLELGGVMLSWAVPRGPSYDPTDKRMAVRVEDHPVSYNAFEGTIPRGQYGAGTVIIWDRGTWTPASDPREGLKVGKLVFTLHGQKLAGLWELVRIAKPGDRQEPWILFKKRDAYARPKNEYNVVTALPDSVVAKPLDPVKAASASARRARIRQITNPRDLPGAVKADLPTRLGPQLATASTALPASGDWIYELKFDGYRIMTRIEQGAARLITRGSHDWSSKMPALARELSGLGASSAWLDGEIVVLGDGGTPDFVALQNAFEGEAADILYFLFDVPFFGGYDLRSVPLIERRAFLRAVLDPLPTERLRFSADFEGDPAAILQSVTRLRLEGIIAKRSDAPYVSRRSETWLKLKTRQRQEFVVGGYTDRAGEADSSEIGSLLLGVYDDNGGLQFVGGVGTGWDSRMATDLKRRLTKLRSDVSLFRGQAAGKRGRWTRRAPGAERWVKPRLVVEVSFAGWTPDNRIRHAKFDGVRLDKPARDVRREASSAISVRTPVKSAVPSATKVSHPERVIDPSTRATKLDLVRYYESVAYWLLPHLKGRPCSLVRGPTGIMGELFFQKHADKLSIPDVKELDPSLWPDHAGLLEIPTVKAIAGAAQMNVIEFHTWNASVKNIGKPDRFVFDLDPGKGITWKRVQEAATVLRAFLQELGLESWLKTSGGKGLHVVVPLAPRHDWATVKGLSQTLVQHVARVIPDRFVAKSGASNRVGKIFIDYLRNSHGATTVAAYSARARPGLGVSMPIPWEMLNTVKSGSQWTIATAREHLSFQSSDPWAAYWKTKQSIGPAMKLLNFKPKGDR